MLWLCHIVEKPTYQDVLQFAQFLKGEGTHDI